MAGMSLNIKFLSQQDLASLLTNEGGANLKSGRNRYDSSIQIVTSYKQVFSNLFQQLGRSELTDRKLCNDKFTWCFDKAELVLYSPCKRTRNLEQVKLSSYNLFTGLFLFYLILLRHKGRVTTTA